jgi:hypothetical protein
MTPVVWLHEDSLRPLLPDLPAVFVFPSNLDYSLKRIVFLYECLLELDCVIRRGDVAEQVLAFAREHHASSVITVRSPSPQWLAHCRRLQRDIRLEIIEPEPFVELPEGTDLRRFARYWKRAEPRLLGEC